MTETVLELEALPPGLVLDGEFVARRDGDPHFPEVCARADRDASIPITFVAFDVLRIDGENMMDASFEERRAAAVPDGWIRVRSRGRVGSRPRMGTGSRK